MTQKKMESYLTYWLWYLPFRSRYQRPQLPSRFQASFMFTSTGSLDGVAFISLHLPFNDECGPRIVGSTKALRERHVRAPAAPPLFPFRRLQRYHFRRWFRIHLSVHFRPTKATSSSLPWSSTPCSWFTSPHCALNVPHYSLLFRQMAATGDLGNLVFSLWKEAFCTFSFETIQFTKNKASPLTLTADVPSGWTSGILPYNYVLRTCLVTNMLCDLVKSSSSCRVSIYLLILSRNSKIPFDRCICAFSVRAPLLWTSQLFHVMFINLSYLSN